MTRNPSMAPALTHQRQMPTAFDYRRNPYLPIMFYLPVCISFAGWLVGGVQFLSDLAMVVMTFLAFCSLCLEIIFFTTRFGTGACTLFGGLLIWISYDYLSNWTGTQYGNFSSFSEKTVATAVLNTTIWVAAATTGMLIPVSRKAEKLFTWVPEPPTRSVYFMILLFLFSIGMSPYIFNAREPFPLSLWYAMTNQHISWISGRSGSVNFNFGAYWAQALQMGEIASIMGAAYAVFIARNLPTKITGWVIWSIFMAIALSGVRRGPVVYMAMPPVLFLYVRYQAQLRLMYKRFSFKSTVVTGVLLLAILIAVQIKIQRRGLNEVEYTVEQLSRIQGNSMFTEALVGFRLMPEQLPYYLDRFPLSTIILPMPKLLYDFVIGPIPRAIWKGKPVDQLWVWYNEATMGKSMQGESYGGTTISTGAVGYWYIRGGPIAVFQGGLLIGWIIALIDKVILNNTHRLMVIIFAFGVLTFLFRSFRGINFHNLYPILIGITLFSIANIVLRSFIYVPAPTNSRRY